MTPAGATPDAPLSTFAEDDAVQPPDLAATAARLLAVDPDGLGGAVLRGPPGTVRDGWLALFRSALPEGAPWRRLPAGADEDRLTGGLDLAATLAAGRPVERPGLIVQARGGALLVPGAERLPAGSALAAARGTVLLLLDEGVGGEAAPARLRERLAFSLDVAAAPVAGERPDGAAETGDIAAARARLPLVEAPPEAAEALVAAALAFGIASMRPPILALRAARAAAALAGRPAIEPDDLALAAALVLAPRATRLPAREEHEEQDGAADETPPESIEPPREPSEVPPRGDDAPRDKAESETVDPASLGEMVVEATRAAVPADLLAGFAARGEGGRRAAANNRLNRKRTARGRPIGTRRGQPGNGARLALVETLRAAAPWQRLRGAAGGDRLAIRREDFRVVRVKPRGERVTIFAVDASGSAALHRLAEVKGAVELILADCYVRRDQVALIAFRGAAAELLLPPTRSPARAKRALAGQAGGGGTPLAHAIEAAAALADAVRRGGRSPLVVLLTDGKANVTRAVGSASPGGSGRAAAMADADAAARQFRLAGLPGLTLDIAPRPSDAVRRLAEAMGTRYVALPHADARRMSDAVLAATPRTG